MNHRIEFRFELERLINRCSMENGSNTPDFILAGYLVRCLEAFDFAMAKRTAWYAPEAATTGEER